MKSDIIELKRMLAERAEEICRHLVPGGAKKGSEWVHDPGHGKIKVELRGTKAGVWSHFGGDGGGDLIDLWAQERGLSLKDALAEVRDYLGVQPPTEPATRRKEHNRPIPVQTIDREDALGMRYLTVDRNIPPWLLQTYGIQVLPDHETIVFNFRLEPDEDPVLIKKRKAGDGERPIPTEADCERVLFGWDVWHKMGQPRRVCLVEGELDAPSGLFYLFDHERYHMPVLSLPYGGGGGDKQRWIESDFERLLALEEVWLALDDDREGDLAADAIAERVGRHKCRRVRLPRKDFNDCLREKVLPRVVLEAFDAAETLDPPALRRAADFEDEVQRLFHPPEDEHVGYTLGIDKIGGKFLCRPGEMTIWSGDSGAGKSQILNSFVPHWIAQGARICVASLEMPGRRTMARAVKQTGGVERPSPEYISRLVAWLGGENEAGGELLIYDVVSKRDVAALLDVFTYARMKYGCDMFVIDSLMRLGLQGDDYTGQEDAVYRMVDWANEVNAHLHLVAHNRKPQTEGQHQGQTGVKGAMEIAANSHNQMEVVRHRDIEDLRERLELGHELTPKQRKRADMPPVHLHCNKQRNGDWEGRAGLWFDQRNYRYRERLEENAMSRRVYCE